MQHRSAYIIKLLSHNLFEVITQHLLSRCTVQKQLGHYLNHLYGTFFYGAQRILDNITYNIFPVCLNFFFDSFIFLASWFKVISSN